MPFSKYATDELRDSNEVIVIAKADNIGNMELFIEHRLRVSAITVLGNLMFYRVSKDPGRNR